MGEAYVMEMTETGGPDVLVRTPRDPRAPGPGDILVKQTAIGLNYIDTYHRAGLYPVSLPFIPGAEGAGIVEAIGDDVDDFATGDRVCYMGNGTYASHYTGPATGAFKLPQGLGEEEAVAVLLKGLTAWMLLFEVRRAAPGDTALIWAPVGGVGSVLVPWASALGVEVIAVTSSADKAERAKALGAQHVILSSDDVAAQVRALTGGAGVDVSYDSVGKSSARASLDSLKPRGWWVTYGNASGPVEPLAPTELVIRGSLNMTRPSLFSFLDTDAARRAAASALFGALRSGTIKPYIGQRFVLDQVGDAHRAIEGGKTIGSTVLIP